MPDRSLYLTDTWFTGNNLGAFGSIAYHQTIGQPTVGPHLRRRREYRHGVEDGSYTVTDSRGHKRVFGTPNAAFERYLGKPWRPVHERR
jgi:hypothetical protein